MTAKFSSSLTKGKILIRGAIQVVFSGKVLLLFLLAQFGKTSEHLP